MLSPGAETEHNLSASNPLILLDPCISAIDGAIKKEIPSTNSPALGINLLVMP